MKTMKPGFLSQQDKKSLMRSVMFITALMGLLFLNFSVSAETNYDWGLVIPENPWDYFPLAVFLIALGIIAVCFYGLLKPDKPATKKWVSKEIGGKKVWGGVDQLPKQEKENEDALTRMTQAALAEKNPVSSIFQKPESERVLKPEDIS